MQKAGEYFQNAIAKDPNYALAYSGLSDYYAFLTLIGGPELLSPSQAMVQARQAAVKAVQLDDSSAEAHASKGHVLHNYDWDFEGGERELKRAIELNSNYAPAHHWYAHLLMQVGRTQQSLEEAQRALELDPMSPFINSGMARQFYLARQYDNSISQCQIALEKNPAYAPARIQLALNYVQKGMKAEGIAQLEAAQSLIAKDSPTGTADLPIVHGMLGYAYGVSGRATEAKKELATLNALSQKRYVPPSYSAIIYMSLGDNDQAFALLDRALHDRTEQMLYLSVEPIVDPLRSDQRFETLMLRVGLKR